MEGHDKLLYADDTIILTSFKQAAEVMLTQNTRRVKQIQYET